jgi:hypothetical protein
VFVVCPNPERRRFSLYVLLYDIEATNTVKSGKRVYETVGVEPLGSWRLVPASAAKAFPDYVPEQIREDYTQASLRGCPRSPYRLLGLASQGYAGPLSQPFLTSDV